MNTFEDFKIKRQLGDAINELGFTQPTPIQVESFSPIMAGTDFVGIAQTGTGKTIAYLLPILQDLAYSEQPNPRVLILAPTTELVKQIVEQLEKLTAYLSVRVLGIFGGSNNIKVQRVAVAEGCDIIVGTPRRTFDLAVTNVLRLNSIKKLVIDEVDIMLDFGYKTQLANIFDMLPAKRQNILYSATMTNYVDDLISDFLVNPVRKTISISGTPLINISQKAYAVHNFYTKVNLLNTLLGERETYSKVLVFVNTKADAELLFELTEFAGETSMIHGSKEINYRTKAIADFESGESRILIATDVIARGIDLDLVSHVISFDTPFYPENYIHRIGRTGRAEAHGNAVLFYTKKEKALKDAIENLMNYVIPIAEFPEYVTISSQLTEEEKGKPPVHKELSDRKSVPETGAAFHEKSAKNSKEKKERVSYEMQLKERFKKPLRRGDKTQNMKKKSRKR